MDDAERIEPSVHSRAAWPAWIILPPSLIAAAVVAAVLGLGRRPRFNAWWQVPATAAFWVLLTCLAAGLMVLLVRRFTQPPAGRGGYLTAIRPVAATVAWFVPAAVFLRFHVVGAAVFAMVASVSLVRLCREVTPSAANASEPALPRPEKVLFLFPPPVSLLHQFLPALGVATLLQASFVAYHWRRGLLMIAMLSMALAAIAWLHSRGSAAQRRRYGMSTAAAALMAAIGLIPYIVPVGRSGWSFPFANREGEARRRSSELIRDSHAGVILVASTKMRVTSLVAPVPSSWRSPLAASPSEPLEIPFDGVYWLYRPPSTRPPERSVTIHGQPDVASFRSPDYHPLIMEARQNLGRAIDLACCSRIRVSVRNADRSPGSVELELKLINTLAEGRPTISLGRERLTIPVNLKSGKVTPGRAQLKFPIPASPAISRFDEVQIRFHLDARRRFRSAKIAIDRFVLEPRRM